MKEDTDSNTSPYNNHLKETFEERMLC